MVHEWVSPAVTIYNQFIVSYLQEARKYSSLITILYSCIEHAYIRLVAATFLLRHGEKSKSKARLRY